MAQRNPMNERNKDGGPSGQTRRSAASVKPISVAAASVKVKGKADTNADKKAAEQKRKDKAEKKAVEDYRRNARNELKQKQSELKAKVAKGEITAKEAEEAMAEAEAELLKIDVAEEGTTKKPALFGRKRKNQTLSAIPGAISSYKDDPEYKKWKAIHMTCIFGGVVISVFAFVIIYKVFAKNLGYLCIIPSYALLVASMTINNKKLKPIIQSYQEAAAQRGWSPKQHKHANEIRQNNAEREQARQAEAAEKKAMRRFKRKNKVENEAIGEADIAEES